MASPPPAFPDQDGIRWYAGLAMQAIIAKHPTVPDTDAEREEIALWSLRMGQAMSAMAKQLHIDD